MNVGLRQAVTLLFVLISPIEYFYFRLASGQKQNQKQAEKRTENAVDLIEIALVKCTVIDHWYVWPPCDHQHIHTLRKTPRSKELIQQILHEEEQVAAAADTSAQIFDSIDSVYV